MAEMNILIICVIAVGASISWMLREWSWYSMKHRLDTTIVELKEINDNLHILLKIEESANLKLEYENGLEKNGNCRIDDETVNKTSADLYEAAYNRSKSQEHQMKGSASELAFGISTTRTAISPTPVFFDWSGVLAIMLSSALIYCEYRYIHERHFDNVERSAKNHNRTPHSGNQQSSVPQNIKRKVLDFAIKKAPITAVYLSSCLALLSVAAWTGLINREAFIEHALKLTISFAISGPLTFVAHNLLRIKQYFPRIVIPGGQQWQTRRGGCGWCLALLVCMT